MPRPSWRRLQLVCLQYTVALTCPVHLVMSSGEKSIVSAGSHFQVFTFMLSITNSVPFTHVALRSV